MKRIIILIVVCLASIQLCQAQKVSDLLGQNPLIFYYLYTDEEMFSDELVLLFPDSSFYYEISAPMMLQYSLGRYTCRGDSLFLTSYQKLDTLKILKVEEYWNPASSYTTIVVVSENNDFDVSRFIINGVSDTLWADSNWMLKYHGDVHVIEVSVELMSRFSRYNVRSPRNNVFIMQVNSEEMHAEKSGHDIILENLLYIKKEQSLLNVSRKAELKKLDTIPKGVTLYPYTKHKNNLKGEEYDIFEGE